MLPLLTAEIGTEEPLCPLDLGTAGIR